MFDIWQKEGIRYWDLAPKLFKSDGEQEMIPFLGAGVSVSDRQDKVPAFQPEYPDKRTLDEVADLLKIKGDARLYLEYAIRTAKWMQAWESVNGAPLSREQFQKKLAVSEYPPFAWELSELFSQLSSYTSLTKATKAVADKALLDTDSLMTYEAKLLPMVKLLALATEIGGSTDPLSSISSYYESTSERKDLWKRLHDVVSEKEKPTETHRLIAAAAKEHLANEYAEDYLIISTNYDSLMETALDEQNVPYVVLWRNRKDHLIHSRFANIKPEELKKVTRQNEPRAPNLCTIVKNRAMTVLYKMHGCLYKELKDEDDGLVITDSDYVEFISQLYNIIPSHVGSLLGAKRLFFLGYSFSDWNVRSLYETVILRTAKGTTQDYAVTRSLSEFERTYFKNRNIIIILTDLLTFTKGIQQELKGH